MDMVLDEFVLGVADGFLDGMIASPSRWAGPAEVAELSPWTGRIDPAPSVRK
jgi:hypothetical protein